jgi:hypothetical protein
MKIKLTEKAKIELQRINSIDEESNEFIEYHDMLETDQLILDADLYETSAYIDNEFDDLNEWCQHTAESEYDDSDGDVVKVKINKMIELGLITIG